jgi:hypothetical protein
MNDHQLTRRTCLILLAGAMIAGPLSAADLYVGPGQAYTTIQAAVDAAAATGDVIHVDPGIYTEQVLITGKDLSITGAGQGVTVIAAPSNLAVFYHDGVDHYPVVGVQAGEVHLSDLTVDGAGLGNLHERFYGLLFRNGGGSLQNLTVSGVRNEPRDDAPHGVAIALSNVDSVDRTFAVTGCLMQDFQIGGLAVIAAAGTPLTLTVDGNTIAGAGPTIAIAQNGIQITGSDIAAALTGNEVNDLAWLGAEGTATGLLLQDCSGSITGNTLVGCQTGLRLSAAAMTVSGNAITVPRPTAFGYGIVIDNTDPDYATFAGAAAGLVRPFAPEARAASGPKATVAVSVTGNTVVLAPDLAVNTGTVGLLAENRQGYDDLEVAATGNTWTGFAVAIVFADSAPTSGVWLAADGGGNHFYACDTGITANLPFDVAAELCWWGALDGPGGDGPGSGSLVSGTVDYDPWFTDLTNLVCVPDTLVLTELVTAGDVVFDYTGGASGRIYGFSIDVAWDTAVAAAGAGDFQRPPAGPFAAATFFTVQEIGDGHVRVDAALGGLVPGVYSGQLFQGEFTFLPAAAHGAETVFTITVNSIRDNQNLTLAGLVPAPGSITVDSSPILQSVLVTDTTIDSSEWTRDGHAISVIAMVIESALDELTCDLTEFGGPVLALGDATVDGQQYTWVYEGISGTGDGPASATVTATDVHAASAALGDAITADNTPPAPLSGLTVTPGHEQIHLAWSAPEPDAGSPPLGVEFRYTAWGGYPSYAGSLPSPPAEVTDGTGIGAGLLTETAFAWAVAARDVYVLAGFVVDFVGNVSTLGDSGAATNYWLGDTDGDGYVDVIADVTALGNSYGLSLGEPGYDGACDVGPTFDYSPRGIPNPQADGYQVQFEDMMVFALNFGEVDPALKFAPGAVPDLRWDQLDAVTWALRLAEPCVGLKGVSLRAELPSGARCQVAPGELLSSQASPVFLRNIAARGLDAGLAAIGFGAMITGSGELVRVTLDAPVTALPVAISARDHLNNELLVDLSAPAGADIPAVHRLGQNFPNPFNPQTAIVFDLPQAAHVHLAIYSVDGRLVATLMSEVRPAGRHEVTWSGRNGAGQQVAAGTYFYALRAGDFRQIRKMMLAK